MFKVMVFIFIAFCFQNTYASSTCNKLLTKTIETKVGDRHKYVIIPSGNGRDDDLIPRYRAFIEKMSEPGGVLDQLGIPRTKQVVEFLSGVDMRAITSTAAAQPMAHFWDGAQMIHAAANPRSLIFEVVFPGPDYHHGYYRDDNSFEQQLSILMHVIGHNHFAVTSHFQHYRASNAPQSAIDFNKVMVAAHEVAPKEEVESYYMFLQTLMSLDDTYSAYYRTPEDFELDLQFPETRGDVEALRRIKALKSRGIKSPTESVLSAMVYRILNSEASQWKKDMARLLPKLAPYRPALVHTQVMNEGWASLMQEIVMDHMGPEYNTMNHWLSALFVTSPSNALSIGDPYWLGVRAWRRLREKFNKDPEIQALETAIEKDRAFIQYASNIIASMDDFQFLNEALDDYMIQGMGLALMRDATFEEAQNLPPPPKDMVNPQPKIITSKDPKRIRRVIIHNAVAKKTIYEPRVKLSSFNRNESGEIELSIDDDFGRQMPIDEKTIAPALYSLAKTVDQSISFEATFLERLKSESDRFDPRLKLEPKLIRLRLVVTPAGRLRVFELSKEDGREVEISETDVSFAFFEEPLHEYLKQLHMEDEARMDFFESENPRFDRFTMQAFNQLVNEIPMTSLIEHVPNAADAITEYQAKVGARMARAFDLAMKGHGGLKKTGKGLFLKTLPSPKDIQFDMKYLQSVAKTAVPDAVDQAMILAKDNPFDGDAVGSEVIGPIDVAPGQGGWRPGPNPGGGDGGPSSEPGDESLDPTWIPIPDDLYAQFLNERIRLPNLKPKSGRVRSKKQRLKGSENRRNGQLLVGQTAVNAIRKGLGAQRALVEGGNGDFFDIDNIDTTEVVELGFSFMRPRDYVVRKLKPINKPDTNAVILFARDASASTWGYEELYKRFIFDMKTLIKSNYKNAKFVYIIFDTKAYVMESETDFFRAALGGGTSYKEGVDKIVEVMETYPERNWDRFPFVIGDLGDMFNVETQESYQTMIDLSSFSGTVKGGYGVEEFGKAMEQMAEENEYFGFTDMGSNPQGYTIEHIRELLKNKDE